MLDKTDHHSRYVTEEASFMLRCSTSQVSLCSSVSIDFDGGSFGGDSSLASSSAWFYDDDGDDEVDEIIIDDNRWGGNSNAIVNGCPPPNLSSPRCPPRKISSIDNSSNYDDDDDDDNNEDFTYITLDSKILSPKSQQKQRKASSIDYLVVPDGCYLSETDDESLSIDGSDFSISLRCKGALINNGRDCNDDRTCQSEGVSYFEETVTEDSSQWELASSIRSITTISLTDGDSSAEQNGKECDDLVLESSNYNATTTTTTSEPAITLASSSTPATTPADTISHDALERIERARLLRQRVMEKRDRENEDLLNRRRKRQHQVCSKLKKLDDHMNAIFGVPVSPNTALKSDKAVSRARAGKHIAMKESETEIVVPVIDFHERRENLELRRRSLRKAFTLFCMAGSPPPFVKDEKSMGII